MKLALGGRRTEKARRRAWRAYIRDIREQLGIRTPPTSAAVRHSDRERERQMATALRPTTSDAKETTKELIPAGTYRVRLAGVGDVQESQYTRKNGDPANDYAFLTFEIVKGRQKGKKFDSAFDWTLEQSLNSHGERKWVSPLREMVEAFLGRELDDDDDDDQDGDAILEHIQEERLQADAAVEVRTAKKDSTKQYNRIVLMSAIEEDEEETPPAKPARKVSPRAVLDGTADLDSEPF